MSQPMTVQCNQCQGKDVQATGAQRAGTGPAWEPEQPFREADPGATRKR